ncbi:MAG: peptidase M17 [Treponema sp.]|nr:peptidase M17 [Treponema sp.]
MKKDLSPSQNIIQNVCAVQKNERVLIIANPATTDIAQDLYTAANEVGAHVSMIFQNEKSSFDNAEEEVVAAIASNPDVCFSISSIKLGKDSKGTAEPYKTLDGQTYSHIFDYLLDGKKTMRAVWTPGITRDMFNRTVNIDYKELAERCERLGQCFKNVVSVHVTSPAGTDVTVPVFGRPLQYDNGDFSKPGTGGNIPAGEVFISPVVGNGNKLKLLSKIESFKNSIFKRGSVEKEEYTEEEAKHRLGTEGVIVFDGSMTFSDGDSILQSPITCKVERGFVTDITGGAEALRLLKTITEAENRSLLLEAEGKLPEGQGLVYRRNARNIGELGIGLNPACHVMGNMLEDEKAFNTCHFAIGENYDNDAPSLIHLDGVVRNPTITLTYEDGSTRIILDEGTLVV